MKTEHSQSFLESLSTETLGW